MPAPRKSIYRPLRRALCIAALATVSVIATAQSGGGYDLTWSSIDAGALILTGGGYELAGIVGQPDTLTLSGGGYDLSGGFLQDSQTIALPVSLSGFTLE